jgi:2-iminoacetate synthase ThiH
VIGHIEFVRERIEHMAAIRDMQDYSHALRGMTNDETRMTKGEAETRIPQIKCGGREYSVIRLSRLDSSFELRHSSFGQYTAFIHWPFQRENTPLGRAQEWDPTSTAPSTTARTKTSSRPRRPDGRASEYLRMLAIARLYFDNIPSLQSSWVTMGPKVGQLALFFGANDMGSVMMEENVVSAAGTTYRLEAREICRLIRDARMDPRPARPVLQRPEAPRRGRFTRPPPARARTGAGRPQD